MKARARFVCAPGCRIIGSPAHSGARSPGSTARAMPSSRRLARSSSWRSGKAPQTQTDAPTNHQPPSASARRPRRVFSSAPAVSRSGSLQPRFYGGDDAEADAIWPRQALGTRIDGPTTPPMRRRSSAFRALLADRLAYCAGAGSPNGSGHDAGLGWRPRHRPGNGAAGKRANPVDLDDLIPSPRYTLRHSRAIDASPEDVWDALHELPVSAFPLTWSLEALRLLPARIAGKTHPPLAGRSFLEDHANPGAFLSPTSHRDLGRHQPSLAAGRRSYATGPRRRRVAWMVATGVDQGGDGRPPRTNPPGHIAENRNPRNCHRPKKR